MFHALVKNNKFIHCQFWLLYSFDFRSTYFYWQNTQPTDKPDAILILGARVLGTSKETALPSRVLQARLDVAIPILNNTPRHPLLLAEGKEQMSRLRKPRL